MILRAVLALLAAVMVTPASAGIRAARYDAPTARYDHAVLGDALEWGMLRMTRDDGRQITITLPESRVFEDLAPRLADVDGDGENEVVVVETSLKLGAQLAIYDETGKIAATPFLGRPYRWLAPVGVADLDGDGYPEIAYVEKPHLRKILRVWRYRDGRLVELAALAGLSNHQIGWDHIPGGIRDCGDGAEIVTADGDWRQVMATRLRDGRLVARPIAPYAGPRSIRSALACRN